VTLLLDGCQDLSGDIGGLWVLDARRASTTGSPERTHNPKVAGSNPAPRYEEDPHVETLLKGLTHLKELGLVEGFCGAAYSSDVRKRAKAKPATVASPA
jgi:hypothetical protein